MTKKIFAEWDTKTKNDLPDSSFAYISPGGTKDEEGKTTPRSLRHLPYKDADGKPDLPHVRNALARLEHTDIPESEKPAIEKKLTALLDKEQASDKRVGVIPLEFKEGDAGATEAGAIPSCIHLVPIGAWDHDLYGEIKISSSDIKEFLQNFKAGVRKGVYITAGHEGFAELPAVGWVKTVEARDDGLWGDIEWNDLGKEALSDKQFKFFSPEFYPTYEDPQSHMVYHNMLTGGALTKSPYFKELAALVMSDKIIHPKQFSTMDLSTILGKKKTDLTQEEKGHIKKHKDKLTDSQQKEYKDVLEDGDEDEDEDEDKEGDDEATKAKKKEAREKKKASENIAKGLNADGTAKIDASEKVQISASELAALKIAADKGQQAFAELEANKLSTEVAKLTFSSSNKAGAFLPKEEGELKKFMATLKAEQRLAFSALMSKVRTDKTIFTEQGTAVAASEGTAQAELDAKIALKQKDNVKMSYSDALKVVMSENPSLQERYENEMLPAGKVSAE